MKVCRFDQVVRKEIAVLGSRDLVMSKNLMSEHESCPQLGMTMIPVEGPMPAPDMPVVEVQPYS